MTPKTRLWYLNAFNQYRQAVGDEWPPTEDHLCRFLNKILARKLKPATVDNYYRAIRAWFNWLHKRQLIEQNPIELTDRPPKDKPLPRAPHSDDVNRFFDVLTEKVNVRWQYCRDLALFSLAIDTGGRISELAALEVPVLVFSGQPAGRCHFGNGVFSPGPDVRRLHRSRAVRLPFFGPPQSPTAASLLFFIWTKRQHPLLLAGAGTCLWRIPPKTCKPLWATKKLALKPRSTTGW